jgi:hypothetical protein
MPQDPDRCAGNLFARLKRISAVRKQNAALASHEQHGCIAGEAAQVQDVREVRDDEGVCAGLVKSKPEPLDPAPV